METSKAGNGRGLSDWDGGDWPAAWTDASLECSLHCCGETTEAPFSGVSPKHPFHTAVVPSDVLFVFCFKQTLRFCFLLPLFLLGRVRFVSAVGLDKQQLCSQVLRGSVPFGYYPAYLF